MAVSKCNSDSTNLTQKLRQLIKQDHMVYQNEKKIKNKLANQPIDYVPTINSEMSVESPKFDDTTIEHKISPQPKRQNGKSF